MFKQRGSGILLHITSLPSPYGIGDLGPVAYKFADFLAEAGQSYWQVLPLNPTDPAFGNSPYSSPSAFAGNTLLVSPEILIREGLLSDGDIKTKPAFMESYCDYVKVIPYKTALLSRAFQHFLHRDDLHSEYDEFCSRSASWLDDFSLFTVIKKHCDQRSWIEWEEGLKNIDEESLEKIRKEYEEEIEKEKFFQYLFFKQWSALRNYCNQRKIKIIGDIPIYVNYDSVDVWTNPGIFKLDSDRKPTHVAGVPPDYFSQTGQLWGNPVYRWETLKETGYNWWIERLARNLELFDFTRIDHFRGLVAFWEVPAGETTAVNGQWQRVPSDDFFNALFAHFPDLPIIAEDLGLITQDVVDVRLRFKLPGMKVLLFAFCEDNPMHPYLPHAYDKGYVVYTGTHDNNTVRGWFEHEASAKEKMRLFRYLGRKVTADKINWELVRVALGSVAYVTIFPLQDVLGLGEAARMNVPSKAWGNWQWRLGEKQPLAPAAKKLRGMVEVYGRIP